MEVQVGAAKVAKYASGESGDTIEMIERPHGGLSIVLVDGQRSGYSAKLISNIVARKAISLLGEGVRDGAVARAAHDYLRTHRRGQVSAELQIVSVDLVTRSLVISRNTHCPAYIVRQGECQLFDQSSQPIGIYANTKPVILELPLEPFVYVVVFTDGMLLAAQRLDQDFDLSGQIYRGAMDHLGAQQMADDLLQSALRVEKGRPRDDMSVMVLAVLPREGQGIRRFSAYLPI
ncbi:MAG: SpoIIE family protein phosphatase [Chloroflexi bacterium]|nr:SpoIIE family protein phosphatase [Chloroflexota bacterium]